ncbi:hypothetical protein BLNAU_19459 [Blattamonas nauphoetae]|uniref:Galectin n=1 Tax=Blattamonas nauphoetae TaxID=2049346 RepID=A0ABQ9X1G2_9EUKA|nr:hypothetical protein BLNAU_19459 [Blattamonas nauphoetae]
MIPPTSSIKPGTTWWTGTSLDFSNFPPNSITNLTTLATSPQHFHQKYVLSHQTEQLIKDTQIALSCDRDYAKNFAERLITYFQTSYVPPATTLVAAPPQVTSSVLSPSQPVNITRSSAHASTEDLTSMKNDIKYNADTLTRLVDSFNSLRSCLESFQNSTNQKLQLLSERVTKLEQLPPKPSTLPPPTPPVAAPSNLPPPPSSLYGQPPPPPPGPDRPRGLFGRDPNDPPSGQPLQPSYPPPVQYQGPTHKCAIQGMTMSSALNGGTPLTCENGGKVITWALASNSSKKQSQRECFFNIPQQNQQGILSLSLTPYFKEGDKVEVGVVFTTDPNEAFAKKNTIVLNNSGKFEVRNHSEKSKPLAAGDVIRIEVDFSATVVCVFVNDLPIPYKIFGFEGAVGFFIIVSSPTVRVELEDCRNEPQSALATLATNYHPTKLLDYSKQWSFF